MRKTQSGIGQQSNVVDTAPQEGINAGLRAQQPANVTSVDGLDASVDIGDHQNEEVMAQSEEVAETENTAPTKHRGKTLLERVYARSIDERDPVIFNKFGQPVGPTDKILAEFASFLGTVAQNSTLAPFTYLSWKDVLVSTKEKIWDLIKIKFILPEEVKKWVLKSVNKKWTTEKSRTKKNHYYAFKAREERLANRPLHIPEPDFEELLDYWDTPHAKEMSKKAKKSREKQGDMHTLGRVSLARKRHKMQQNHPNKLEPSMGEVYVESRKRVPGRKYLTQDEETLKNIEKMKELLSSENGSNESYPYSVVITKKEHSGRLLLYGLGVTKSSLKRKDSRAPFILPSEFMDGIMQQMEQRVCEQVEQKISGLISKIREANPRKDFVIPDISSNQVDESTSQEDVARDIMDVS